MGSSRSRATEPAGILTGEFTLIVRGQLLSGFLQHGQVLLQGRLQLAPD